MSSYNLPFPDVTGRKMINPYFLHRGDVVAFKSENQRTGIIVMEYSDMMMVAVNLYEEKGGLFSGKKYTLEVVKLSDVAEIGKDILKELLLSLNIKANVF